MILMLEPLVSFDEFALRLKADITTFGGRAVAVLDDVSAQVRAYTGQQFTLATTTDLLARPRGGIIRLPQRPVLAVSAVTDTNDNAILYTWYGDDRVELSLNLPDTFAWEPWRTGIRYAKVTYQHGYEEIPADIVAIVCQVAGRALGVPAEESGIQQESIAGYSYGTGAAAAQGPVGLLVGERALLDMYAAPQIGTIQVNS